MAPVLERVARTRARMAYALYVGLGDLRRAAPQATMSGSEAASIIELVVDTGTARPGP